MKRKLRSRDKFEGDKRESIERLRAQVREAEIRHDRKINEIVAQYEKRLAGLSDKRVIEREGTEVIQKRQLGDVKRIHESQLATQKIQYEEKLAELNDKHQREMQTLHQRYSDQIDRMSVVVKKT
jgi:anti-sigma-K factor RskA